MKFIQQSSVFSFFILALCLGSFAISAQNPVLKALGFRSLDDTVAHRAQGLAVVPLLYYTPDTRWAAGASVVYYFTLEARNADEQTTRLSYIQTLADYTQNEQFDFWSTWNIFTRNENYLFKGEFRFRNFPDRFYGIGNATPESDMERYSYDLYSFKSLFLKKIAKNWFAGLDLHTTREFNFQLKEDGILQSGSVLGAEDVRGVAFGAVITNDSRDNVINAYQGRLLEVSTYRYLRRLGSTFDFLSIQSLGQWYWQFKPKQILAFQYRGIFQFGDVPFLDMAMAGNDDLLRGYPRNRFRDHHFLGGQAEYRFPIYKRFGGVGFLGAGDVFSQLSDLSWSHLKYSVGCGLRFLVDPAERLNVRFDVGWGRNSVAYYLMVTEAF